MISFVFVFISLVKVLAAQRRDHGSFCCPPFGQTIINHQTQPGLFGCYAAFDRKAHRYRIPTVFKDEAPFSDPTQTQNAALALTPRICCRNPVLHAGFTSEIV